jgi:hypothetical protein
MPVILAIWEGEAGGSQVEVSLNYRIQSQKKEGREEERKGKEKPKT